jgi:hypothetical protein
MLRRGKSLANEKYFGRARRNPGDLDGREENLPGDV